MRNTLVGLAFAISMTFALAQSVQPIIWNTGGATPVSMDSLPPELHDVIAATPPTGDGQRCAFLNKRGNAFRRTGHVERTIADLAGALALSQPSWITSDGRCDRWDLQRELMNAQLVGDPGRL